MLAYLPPLFFFAALMGSPVVGFLVFVVLGVIHGWQSWRAPYSTHAFAWTRQDSWLALSFMSIALFKALSVLWSPSPALAWGNFAWHLYFLFWPFALLGLARCQSQSAQPVEASTRLVENALAAGLIVTALYSLYLVKWQGAPDVRALGNVGITAQLTMAVGTWNLLALSRPGSRSAGTRALLGLAWLSSWMVLVLSTRRLELLGFAALNAGIWLYRFWPRLSPIQRASLIAVALTVTAGVLTLRGEKFAQGFAEIGEYFARRTNGEPYVDSSWGARLEMWRLGWQGFVQQPWLGLSASARAYDMAGAPPMAIFGHRHFHSHLMQTLVEGGLLGLGVTALALWHSTRVLIVQAWEHQREWALLAAGLLAAYALEGAASAALVYDKPNALLVVASAWVWLQLRPLKPAL